VGWVWGSADFAKQSAYEAGPHTQSAASPNRNKLIGICPQLFALGRTKEKLGNPTPIIRPAADISQTNYNCGKSERNDMATLSVRIDDALVNAARTAAKAEFRTVQGQLEYWALVGRAALDNPDLPVSFVAESLMSLAEPRGDSTAFFPRSSQPTATSA
jgi:hypothetical protein